MKTRLFLMTIGFAACAFSQQAYSIVVNKSNTATSITKTQLRQMMLGETAAWPGGAKVMVLLGPVGDAPRTVALKDNCGMGEPEFMKHGMQAAFGGTMKGSVKTLPSASSVRLAVQVTPGALGVVDPSVDTSQVKVLTIE